MRRKNEIKLRLFDDELSKLNLEVEKSGLSRESYLRSLIKHELPRGKPTEDYLEVIHQLKMIGNNLNQIAVIAHKTNAIDIVRYKEEVKKLKIQLAEIKRIASQPIQLKE
ncbi:MobC family plasmid mobilization relaxosome protein [[Clostridium] innocuum]|uniref:plasmid mobilization protein n=1 Tax=Bacillota TaxID=1239 RepID=UPI0018990D46|nr:plasmid mobilization relaxosome protein MobC [Faecalitalea cylindroides]MCG4662400.1 MobC family plasmid mobilization relaxosome protein [[Clostridium] innocuum]